MFEKIDIKQYFKSEDDINYHQIHLVIKNQLRSDQAFTAHTKTRGEVTGGGAKPYRQKGTGRARRGTNRTPLRRGGGIVFGPRFRVVTAKSNKKVARKAIRDLFLHKASNMFQIKYTNEQKTRDFAKHFDVSKKYAIIGTVSDEALFQATRNLPNVYLMTVQSLNLNAISYCDDIVLTQTALTGLEG